MSIARQLVRGFRNLLRRERADGDIADEVDSFFAEAKADMEARGLTAHDAARAIRMMLGSSTALREQVRSYGWENMVDGVFQDLRYTLRRLRATPGFTVVSIRNSRTGTGSDERHFQRDQRCVAEAVALCPSRAASRGMDDSAGGEDSRPEHGAIGVFHHVR